MKIRWVEILLIISIILIPMSYAARLIYGKQWQEWEYGLIKSWGINPLVFKAVIIIIFIGYVGYFFIYRIGKQ